eukprot:6880565-Pyramimonas_sp.AAC.1
MEAARPAIIVRRQAEPLPPSSGRARLWRRSDARPVQAQKRKRRNLKDTRAPGPCPAPTKDD